MGFSPSGVFCLKRGEKKTKVLRVSPVPRPRASPVRPDARKPESASTPLEARERVIGSLLRELGSQLRRGHHAAHSASRPLPTGLPSIDALVGGGLPGGKLCEIVGPASSGRTSLALGLLARATRAGEWVALVDEADAFDPTSADRAGVALPRLLWARPPDRSRALRCCQQLLAARGFALVVWDAAGKGRQPTLPGAAWQKLARGATSAGTALVVLCEQRLAGSCSELSLELQRAQAHFGGAPGAPALLEGLEVAAAVLRERNGSAGGTAHARLSVRPPPA